MAGPGPLGGPENHLWFKRSLGMSAFVWITKSWRANPHGEGKEWVGSPPLGGASPADTMASKNEDLSGHAIFLLRHCTCRSPLLAGVL